MVPMRMVTGKASEPSLATFVPGGTPYMMLPCVLIPLSCIQMYHFCWPFMEEKISTLFLHMHWGPSLPDLTCHLIDIVLMDRTFLSVILHVQTSWSLLTYFARGVKTHRKARFPPSSRHIITKLPFAGVFRDEATR